MQNIDKRFDAVVALSRANITLHPGEIRALLGSNGSGKSTLVKILGGLVRQNHGQVFIDGQPVKINSAKDARNLGISVAYQDLSLIPKMSVMDNLMLGREPKGFAGTIDIKASRNYAMELLSKLKILCSPDDLIETLPTSTQSMIEVAKALAWKPRVLLLDEVTAALHHDEVETLFSVISELREHGLAIVVVTHRMNEVYNVCTSATILRNGETVDDVVLSNTPVDEIIFKMTGKYPEKNQDHDHVIHEEAETILSIFDMHVLPKVNGISMNVRRGEIIGIGGLQGQGQSEFIRAILGVTGYDKGIIRFKGNEVKYTNAAQAISDGMGFISGDRTKEAIFPIRSIAENIFASRVAQGSDAKWLSPKTIKSEAEKVVREYSIKIGDLDDPASSLSGGNQQKLIVGRWMNVAPNLLLLDDPTKGVDVVSRREIHQFLFKAAESGMTIIIVSSDSEELLSISDTIYVFYEGKISGELSGISKTEEHLVSAMMGLNEDGEKEGVN